MTIPTPHNEPVQPYLPGSPQRAELKAELSRQLGEAIEIPLIIDGREVRTSTTTQAVLPHHHRLVIATVHMAGETEVAAAIEATRRAKADWERWAPEDRAAVFLKAAELLAGPWRARMNAATMLNQSKTCHQAEIDAACESIDFFRFNCTFMESILSDVQPPMNAEGVWNRVECRPLEGFVYAITPFNFTSIAGNLPHAPALMGNTVIWKPSPSALYSNYVMMQLFEAAGLPAGVINFLPGDAEAVSAQLLAHPDFAGLHYTGSTAVFRSIWQTVAGNLSTFRSYPRIVGETGGKDFIVAHPSADPAAVVTAIVRGGYEFQGQKCSAASRCYLPATLWSSIKDELVGQIKTIRMGDIADFSNFMGAVIHRRSLEKCRTYIGHAQEAPASEVLAGGTCDDSVGFFVEPTLITTTDPLSPSMCEEIFGPVVTVYVYPDSDFEDVLELCDRSSPYALTGAIFATDRAAVDRASTVLRHAAGNFYINDKPTGAVVGQQPFGGGRASGTNDKAGSPLNLLRWVSPRTIKETFVPPVDYRYGFMAEP